MVSALLRDGIGPVTCNRSSVATVGDRSCFRNGRQFAAWLGAVPRQRSSGGKSRLFGQSANAAIATCGTLMIHGARAVLGKGPRQGLIPEVSGSAGCGNAGTQTLSPSLLPNKNARIVWAVLARGDTYNQAEGAPTS